MTLSTFRQGLPAWVLGATTIDAHARVSEREQDGTIPLAAVKSAPLPVGRPDPGGVSGKAGANRAPEAPAAWKCRLKEQLRESGCRTAAACATGLA
jgi:hypothetical protein